MEIRKFKELAIRNTNKLSNSGDWKILVLHFFDVFLEKEKKLDPNEKISRIEMAKLVNEFINYKKYPENVRKIIRFGFKKLFDDK